CGDEQLVLERHSHQRAADTAKTMNRDPDHDRFLISDGDRGTRRPFQSICSRLRKAGTRPKAASSLQEVAKTTSYGRYREVPSRPLPSAGTASPPVVAVHTEPPRARMGRRQRESIERGLRCRSPTMGSSARCSIGPGRGGSPTPPST